MTLIEIMIALAVFGMTIGGLVSSMTLMHKSSISNVTDSVALHAAEGIMEQIRVMPYESRLLVAAQATPGTITLPLNRYVPAQTDGTPAQINPQDIPVNTTTGVDLENVNQATTVNAKYVVTGNVHLPINVRILLRPVNDVNFARGLTVELIYTYRYRSSDTTPVSHTLRTFIPKSVS